MKKRFASGYTFDASEKTIVHASFSDVGLAGIQLITNVTDQIIIYNFADTTKGGTLSTDTLTLEYDTTSMSDTDELMILVEDGASSESVAVASIATGDNNIGNVDVLTIAAGDNNIGNVDIASAIPAGTNAIGKLAANSGVDIGDVDITSVVPGTGATNLGKAEDAGHTTGDTGVFALGVRNDTPNTALTNADADYSPISVNKLGSVRIAPPEDDFAVAGSNHVKKYYTSAGAATDGIIWSPAAGKRWYVTDIFINVSAAATVTLEDDKAGGDEAVWKAELAANSGWSHHFGTPLFSGEDAADLLVTTSAGNVYITVTGYEI